jgi:hypothetical protein
MPGENQRINQPHQQMTVREKIVDNLHRQVESTREVMLPFL